MSSGFPPADEMDVTVLRRSVWVLTGLGACISVLAEEFLESQEKGPANFLGGGAGAGEAFWGRGFGAGGGPHGTEGRAPANPCERKGSFDGGGDADVGTAVGAGSSMYTSCDVIVVDPDLVSLVLEVLLVVGLGSGWSPSCTSSREEVEIRRAVSKGDFVGGSPSCALVSSSPV